MAFFGGDVVTDSVFTLTCVFSVLTFQNQPSKGVLRKNCSKNMQQIYWRTPMPKCDLNKVVVQLC